MTNIEDLFASAAKEAKQGNKPIPTGTYDVTVFAAEVKPYTSKQESGDFGKKVLNVQFRISEGQPQSNRRAFERISLFPRKAPTQKHPEGLINYDLWNFFQGGLGYSDEQLLSLVKKVDAGESIEAEIRALLGSPLSVEIIERAPDDWNPDGSNSVRKFKKATGATASTVSADVWGGGTPATPTQVASADVWGSAPGAAPAQPQADPALAAAAASSGGF